MGIYGARCQLQIVAISLAPDTGTSKELASSTTVINPTIYFLFLSQNFVLNCISI